MLKTVGNPSTRFGDQTITNGNLVIGTAGNGIDFSSDPSAPGMTSELLDDYEEGTWTPSVAAIVGSITSYTSSGTYTKVGRLVTVNFDFTITNNGTGSVGIGIQGIPFASASAYAGQGTAAEIAIIGYQCLAFFANVNTIYVFKYDWTYPAALNARIVGTVSYIV